MSDPTHDNLWDRLTAWFKDWGWIWLLVMTIMFFVLWLAGKLNP